MQTTVDSSYDVTMDAAYNSNSDLGQYLKRPVEIDTYNWAIGTPLFQKIDPWKLWSQNKWVAKKLANYELLRCKLHVKFVINGTQFHYGKVMVGYNPFTGPYDEVTVTRNFLDQDLVNLSQKPHVFLDPSGGEGAEMILPYFWNDNYFSLTKKDLDSVGDLYYKSMGNLNMASSGTDPVTITTYAWAEDVVLTMPTSLNSYTPQGGNSKSGKKNTSGRMKNKTAKPMNSGDEYGKGVISQPAQAIAKAAGALEMIPFIAPYARASGMVATKIGQVAALFGYSRPNIVKDRDTYSPELAGVMANVNASDTSNKLSFDSKQEVSIDSRVAGLTGEDEMTANSILTRESYVTSFTINESDAAGKILWNTYITPSMFASLDQELHMTPACLWSQHFNYWQGSIKLRFQVVKSKFHKGRILLRWDPRSNAEEIDTNAVYSRIVDITDQDDFEVVIGWGQSDPFLKTSQAIPGFEPYSTTRLTTDNSGYFNGVLEVNVVNQLVSPNGTTDNPSPVRVNVYASMCDDAKFGQPISENIVKLTPFKPQFGFEPQSGENEMLASSGEKTSPTCPDQLETIAEELETADETMNVFFGESITSLRELIKRYQFNRAVAKPLPGQSTITVTSFKTKARPYIAGWDPFGLDMDTEGTTPLTVGVNGPLNIWSLCYAGWRGSLRHKYVYSGDVEGSLRVRRMDYTNAYGFTPIPTAYGDLDADLTTWLSANTITEGWDGMKLNHAQYNKILEVEVPFYTSKRFLSSRMVHANSLLGDSVEISETLMVPGDPPKRSYVEDYVAAGDDYSLMFFTGVPVLYRYFVGGQ